MVGQNKDNIFKLTKCFIIAEYLLFLKRVFLNLAFFFNTRKFDDVAKIIKSMTSFSCHTHAYIPTQW